MFKYNIGDVVLYKGRKECIVGRTYIETAGDISIEYELSLKHKNIKEDELKELPNYSIEIKDKNGKSMQRIYCDEIFKLSDISELCYSSDEMYVNGEKVDYLIGVKF